MTLWTLPPVARYGGRMYVGLTPMMLTSASLSSLRICVVRSAALSDASLAGCVRVWDAIWWPDAYADLTAAAWL